MTQLHAHWTGKCWDNVQTKHMCQVMTIHMCVPNMCVLVRKACVVYGVEPRHGNCHPPPTLHRHPVHMAAEQVE